MNAADPLAQLRDIHLPEPVSWWPPAPGWWILALLALAAISLCIFSTSKLWLRNRYRRAALQELKTVNFAQGSQQTLLADLSILVRRVAIQAYGRMQVASLSGDRWLAFLDRTGRTDRFTRGEGKILGSGLYQSSVEVDMEKLKQIVHYWIKEHRR